MGFVRIVFNAVLWPLLIYLALVGHVCYHTFLQDGGPFKPPAWTNVSPADKKAIIDARRPLVKEIQDFYLGKDIQSLLKRTTDDFTFEDSVEKLVGAKEVTSVMKLFQKLMGDDAVVKFNAEHHAANEVIVDLTFNCKVFSYPTSLNILAHFYIDQTEGHLLKVFKAQENWNNNPPLNEKTVVPSVLGKVHSMLRRFHGMAIVFFVENFM